MNDMQTTSYHALVLDSKSTKRFSTAGKIASYLLAIFCAIVVFAPLLLPYDPYAIDLGAKLAPMSAAHWLGTDQLGRDILTRLIYGARISLSATMLILVCIIALGILVGGISGAIGGRFDRYVMRVCDVFLVLPTIVLALFFVGILGSGLINIIIAIALTHWAYYARIIRSIVFTHKYKEYVVLSHVYGASFWQNFRRNFFTPICIQCLVLATMDIGHIILHIAALSFIGLGVQPPTAEWGIMLSDAADMLWVAPEMLLYPGLALFITVALCNILGDNLRDYFDLRELADTSKKQSKVKHA